VYSVKLKTLLVALLPPKTWCLKGVFAVDEFGDPFPLDK